MPLFNLTDLHARLSRNQRLIGIDPGTRTIGLALSDVRRVVASPYGSIKRGKLVAAAEVVLAIAKREDAGGLVVGLPLQMDGRLGPAAQAARDWTFALMEATGLPAAMWDERLSSAEANRSRSLPNAAIKRGAIVAPVPGRVVNKAASAC